MATVCIAATGVRRALVGHTHRNSIIINLVVDAVHLKVVGDKGYAAQRNQ